MSENCISIATANTQEARMILHPDGLKPFTEQQIDILLLQEVLGVEEEGVRDRLALNNFDLVCADTTLGLAIAVNSAADIQIQDKSDTSLLQAPGKLGKPMEVINQSHRLRGRGMLGAHLTTQQEESITVATTHPIVFVRARARRKQIAAMGHALQQPFYNQPRLVVGGDMNHYPGPQRIDLAVQQNTGMERVRLSEPTWHIEGSKHEWLAKIGSLATRKTIDEYDAELDAMLYRGVDLSSSSVLTIQSDHKAIVAEFQLR